MIASIICAPNLSNHWNPQEYTESNDGQFKHGIKEIHKLALKGDESLLDIGCGDGRLSHHIATTYIPQGTLLGIDSSPAMIEYAQSAFQSPNLSFTIGDISHYHVKQQYDVVISFWTLHWVKQYDKALRTIAQLLKPHGKTLLCHIIDHYPIDGWIEKLLTQPKWQTLKKTYVKTLRQPSLEQVINAIRTSDLVIENIEIKKTENYPPCKRCEKTFYPHQY
jgi:Trans-aconitate methyltransferase